MCDWGSVVMINANSTGELFGREAILEALANRLDIALKGKACIDLLEGDAGIGKTAILSKFISLHPEAQALYVQCSALTDADDLYKPCSDLLNTVESIKWKEESKFKKLLGSINVEKIFDVGGKILGFVPGLELPSAIIDLAVSAYAGDSNPEKLLEVYKNDKVKLYADILLGLSMKKPLIVIFDDLHWADRGTVNVLKHIFQQILEARQGDNDKKFNLLLIGALRGSEARADSLHNGINEMFNFMERYNFGRSQKLMLNHTISELDESAIRSLITYDFDNDENLSDGIKQWISESSKGNPLLLGNIIDVLRENGAIQSTNEGWKDFDEVEYTSAAPTLKGRMLRLEKQGAFKGKSIVALESLRNLNDTELKVLYVAAIFKDYFTVESLAYVCSIAESDLYWPINRLVKMGFLTDQGEFNNGIQIENRYRIQSKGLIDALRTDMSHHQITFYEDRLGDFYASKIKSIDDMEKIIESLDVSGVAPKAVISEKYSKINTLRDDYHKLASYHYRNGSNSLKAIEHGLFSIERLVDRYQETENMTPAPLELDSLRKTIDSQISLYERLFDNVINDLVLGISENDEFVHNLKIRALRIYAEYYSCFGQFTKAGEYLKTALLLTNYTETKVDDIKLMLSVAEINYEAGNYNSVISIIDKLLTFVKSNKTSIDQEYIDKIIEEMLNLINKDYILQEMFIRKLINLVEYLESDFIKECRFAELQLYLRTGNVKSAQDLIKTVKKQYPDIIWGFYVTDIVDEATDVELAAIDSSVAEIFASDEDDVYEIKYKNDFVKSINTCRLLLPVLVNEVNELDNDEKVQSVLVLLELYFWLNNLANMIEPDDLSEYDIDIDVDYLGRIKYLKLLAKEVIDDTSKQLHLADIYIWLLDSIERDLYVDERDSILFYLLKMWPQTIQEADVVKLFDLMMESHESRTNNQSYKDNIEAWSVYYGEYPSEKLANLIVNSVEEKIKTLEPDSYICDLITNVLLLEDDFKSRIDLKKYIDLLVSIYSNLNQYDEITGLIEAYPDLVDQDIIQWLDNEVDQVGREELILAEVNYPYDGDDQFSRYLAAQKLLERVNYISLYPDKFGPYAELSLYVQAHKLMQNNEYAETQLDDVCDSIVEELDNIEDLDLPSLREIFSNDLIQGNIGLTKLYLQLKYRFESMRINEKVGDNNRVSECIAGIIIDVHSFLNDDDSEVTIEDVENYLSTFGYKIESLLKKFSAIIVNNCMLEKVISVHLGFTPYNYSDFAENYIKPTVFDSINNILEILDNKNLTDYVRDLIEK